MDPVEVGLRWLLRCALIFLAVGVALVALGLLGEALGAWEYDVGGAR